MTERRIEDWVAKNCIVLKHVLDTAEAAIGAHQVNINTRWNCPNCPVVVATRKRALGGYGLRLEKTEKCDEIPPLDEPLK